MAAAAAVCGALTDVRKLSIASSGTSQQSEDLDLVMTQLIAAMQPRPSFAPAARLKKSISTTLEAVTDTVVVSDPSKAFM